MARARNVKPGLFKNEILGVADPMLTLLFQGLWCLADREGLLEDRPLKIKGEIFPYRDGLDVNGYLTELQRMGFIVRYIVAGQALIHVVKFKKHQTPHNTEKASELPPPTSESLIPCGPKAVNVISPLNNAEETEAKRPDLLIPDSILLKPDTGLPTTPQAAKFDFSRALRDYGIEEKIIAAWLVVRKSKKASNTEIALTGFVRAAGECGLSVPSAVLLCAERSWAGLQPEYLKPKAQGSPSNSGFGKAGQETADNARKLIEKYRAENGQGN